MVDAKTISTTLAKVVSLFSTEAEYIAATNACK